MEPEGSTYPAPKRMAGILGRGIGAGSLAGLVVGGISGTVIVPVLGTFVGVLAGAVVGAVLGLFCGAALAFCLSSGPARRGAARGVAGGSATVGGALVGLAAHGSGPWLLAWIATCAASGALLGPYVATGTRGIGRLQRQVVGPTLGVGAALGAGAGASVGTTIGLLSDPAPLVLAAVVEGALLGLPCGLLAAGVVAVARAAFARPVPRG